jgi:hypothetical protein
MKLPDEHDSVMVNGSVRLELRSVATGVSAAAWQLAWDGVRAREHARAPFGQGEQGSTPSSVGVREQNAGGKREQPGSARLTETTHYALGMPSCEQRITVKNGACLATVRRSVVRV